VFISAIKARASISARDRRVIDISFLPVGSPQTDDPPAITGLSIDTHQHDASDLSERQEANLSIVDPIIDPDQNGTIEEQNRQIERQTPLAPGLLALGFVPLVVHQLRVLRNTSLCQ